MQRINEDIASGQIKKVYLLYGEEDYLKQQFCDRIQTAVARADDTMNVAHYEGKETDPAVLIDLAETMPFMADRRLIVVEDSGFFKNATPLLADYMKELPDTVCFVFVESEVDRRSKLFKAVQAAGRAVEFPRQDEKTLLTWIASRMKQADKKISSATARYLLEKVGDDMENLDQEMEKLIDYTYGAEAVTVADIEAICTTKITDQIFAMVDAVALRDQKQALRYYDDLLALKEAPMRILYLLTRQFRLLLEVKSLLSRGVSQAQIAKTAKVPSFAAGKYIRQCGAFSESELMDILEEAARTEEAVKTGRLNDRMGVELLIIKYSTAAA